MNGDGPDDRERIEIPRPRELMDRYGVRPKKSLGQHFLVDGSYVKRILDAAEIDPDDVVLEVGPGLGVLTGGLLQRGARVVAVEIDSGMRAILRDRFGDDPRLRIVDADILEVSPRELLADMLPLPMVTAGVVHRYKVVANLPYYITSAVLRHVLDAPVRPERMVVMVQKEVAQRMMAPPGDRGVLSVATQYYAAVQRVATVPAGAFHPRPNVDSAVVRLDVRTRADELGPAAQEVFRVVRAGFSQRRKQLINSLSSGLDQDRDAVVAALDDAAIDPRRRAQSLTIQEWIELTSACTRRGLVGNDERDDGRAQEQPAP